LPVPTRESLRLVEYALLAQGLKIAASAHQKFSIRPVGRAAAGPFLHFGPQRLVAQ
jgi:hypothetical protein